MADERAVADGPAVAKRAAVADGRAVADRPADTSGGRSWWFWLRLFAGAAVLVVVVGRLGAGPLLHGVSRIGPGALALAAAIGGVTTIGSAWRWSLVAGRFGVRLPVGTAVASYYRSQFLNSTLPGGVLGDVHRAVRHGGDIGDLGLAVRAVAVERVAGQVVQVAVAGVVLFALPSPVRDAATRLGATRLGATGLGATGLGAAPFGAAWLAGAPVAGLVVAGGLVLAAGAVAVWALVPVIADRTGRRTVHTRQRPRPGRGAGPETRAGTRPGRSTVATAGVWLGVGLTSTVAIGGHVATFLLAARTAGAQAPVGRLLPLALLALLAMAVPLNVAGWGPREGATAWAFGAAGLGAGLGVSTAVVYGVLALVASLPGAVVLVVARRRGRSAARPDDDQPGGACVTAHATATAAGPGVTGS